MQLPVCGLAVGAGNDVHKLVDTLRRPIDQRLPIYALFDVMRAAHFAVFIGRAQMQAMRQPQ